MRFHAWVVIFRLACQQLFGASVRCGRFSLEQWQIHRWKEPEGPLQQISSIYIALKCKNCSPMKLVLPNQVKFCIKSWICPLFWFRPGENSFEGTVSGGMHTASACVPAGPGRRTVSCCCHFESPSLENCVPDRLGWLACTHLSHQTHQTLLVLTVWHLLSSFGHVCLCHSFSTETFPNFEREWI